MKIQTSWHRIAFADGTWLVDEGPAGGPARYATTKDKAKATTWPLDRATLIAKFWRTAHVEQEAAI